MTEQNENYYYYTFNKKMMKWYIYIELVYGNSKFIQLKVQKFHQ